MNYSNGKPSIIKSSSQTITYTQDQLNEYFLCQDQINGHFQFLNHYYIYSHYQGITRYEPSLEQSQLIENYHKSQISINLTERQRGKTTSALGYIMWLLSFRPHSNILIGSFNARNSSDIIEKLFQSHAHSPSLYVPKITHRTKNTLVFENQSSVVALPVNSSFGRGTFFDLAYFDEFLFCDPSSAIDAWSSLMPSMTKSSKIIINSSIPDRPFHKAWEGITAFGYKMDEVFDPEHNLIAHSPNLLRCIGS